jgi:transcriptional regulator
VPTWNYVAVHAAGTPRIVEGEDAFLQFLADLSAFHEAGFETPWTMDKMKPGLPRKLLRGIVHIEIGIARLEGKAKLGQNRDATQRTGAVAGLRDTGASGDAEVAALMAALDA